MSKAKMVQLENDLISLWEKYSCKPTYMQMSLGNYRKHIAPREDLQDYAVEFLKVCDENKIPDEAVVVITPGRLALLVNDQDRLLSFR